MAKLDGLASMFVDLGIVAVERVARDSVAFSVDAGAVDVAIAATVVIGVVGVAAIVVVVDLIPNFDDVVGSAVSCAVSGVESSEITTASRKSISISGIDDLIVGVVTVGCN